MLGTPMGGGCVLTGKLGHVFFAVTEGVGVVQVIKYIATVSVVQVATPLPKKS